MWRHGSMTLQFLVKPLRSLLLSFLLDRDFNQRKSVISLLSSVEGCWRRELFNRSNCLCSPSQVEKGAKSLTVSCVDTYPLITVSPLGCAVSLNQNPSSQSLQGVEASWSPSAFGLLWFHFPLPCIPTLTGTYCQFLSIFVVLLSELACFCQLQSHFLAGLYVSLLFSYHSTIYSQLPWSCFILHSFIHSENIFWVPSKCKTLFWCLEYYISELKN